MEHNSRVVVTDIEMPFGSMVMFMVKWALASIPAFVILSLVGFILALFFIGATDAIRGLLHL